MKIYSKSTRRRLPNLVLHENDQETVLAINRKYIFSIGDDDGHSWISVTNWRSGACKMLDMVTPVIDAFMLGDIIMYIREPDDKMYTCVIDKIGISTPQLVQDPHNPSRIIGWPAIDNMIYVSHRGGLYTLGEKRTYPEKLADMPYKIYDRAYANTNIALFGIYDTKSNTNIVYPTSNIGGRNQCKVGNLTYPATWELIEGLNPIHNSMILGGIGGTVLHDIHSASTIRKLYYCDVRDIQFLDPNMLILLGRNLWISDTRTGITAHTFSHRPNVGTQIIVSTYTEGLMNVCCIQPPGGDAIIID